ncbi:MAG: homoserine dehydrogenase [Ruminococcaceae bacterium]|nr:homoserine dehydrogenase [Oscillospiraceae bacterium]
MINIAILGYGTVGSGVYEVIGTNADSIKRKAGKQIVVKKILDLRDFDDHPQKELFTKNYDEILSDNEIEIVVETIGGLEPAYRFTKSALLAGKSVVTSNKELVAAHGTELLGIAREQNVNYLFEASVGGGIPIIRPLNGCLAANEITEIFGILNGTTNYILTKMIKDGISFETALAQAQEKGYAERNPAADVEGHDACRKICILASLAFGKAVDSSVIHTEGITNITLDDVKAAEALGYVIKLIGYTKSEEDKVICRVSPMLVPNDNPLSGVEDVFNAIMVRGNQVGDVMFYGRGAGKLPTASAVVADVIDIVKGSDNKNFIWESSDKDYIDDYKKAEIAMFVRASGTDEASVKALFGDKTVVLNKTELCFITPADTEENLVKKLSMLDGEVITTIRVMQD